MALPRITASQKDDIDGRASLCWNHLRDPTVLDILIWCNGTKTSVVGPRNNKSMILDTVIALNSSSNFGKLFKCQSHRQRSEDFIDQYGVDITQTCRLFRGQMENDSS